MRGHVPTATVSRPSRLKVRETAHGWKGEEAMVREEIGMKVRRYGH